MSNTSSAEVLAARLRELRKSRWSDISVRQAELAAVLSKRKTASVQLISSWERAAKPAVPPEDRLDAIATFFSTRRSIEAKPYRLLDANELTPEESAARDALRAELVRLRTHALSEESAAGPRPAPESLVGRGPWHFPDGAPVTIVCAELPDYLQRQLPLSERSDPDRSELARVVDLDSLFELHGHIRAVNPDTDVQFRSSELWRSDDSAAHLVLLGGVDWNKVTEHTMRTTKVPVEQYSDDENPTRGGFRVTDGDETQSFTPKFDGGGGHRRIVEDVGHFFRAPSPLNQKRTVTVCNGMYGKGVYGTVRALTDKVFRDRNAEYLEDTFSDRSTFSLLFRVSIVSGMVSTPDWTAPGTVLHAWPAVG
jgi:hypothetical protein